METKTVPTAAQNPSTEAVQEDELQRRWNRVVRRRAFLKGVGIAGATGAAGALLPTSALAAATASPASGRLTKGDADVLRFLAAAEILESDLWTQYHELGGAASGSAGAGGGNAAYVAALKNIDGDMPQYITDNTDDELSHAAFLNAYLVAHGARPVDLSQFKTLAGSSATGSSGSKRLTSLKSLNVDTSYYTRYRSSENPDFGDAFGQVVNITARPSIPRTNADDTPSNHIQAIANTAAFHFAMIEQGGSSLYTTMAQKVTSLEVLRIVVSIGGVEVDHFSLWHDKLGATLAPPLNVTDGALSFPDLSNSSTELQQINKILPEPCDFIREDLPDCSVIRPSTVANSGARASARALTANNLFAGQSPEFFATIQELAEAADAAQRQLGESGD